MLRVLGVVLLMAAAFLQWQDGVVAVSGARQILLPKGSEAVVRLPQSVHVSDGQRYAFDFVVPPASLGQRAEFSVHYHGCLEALQMQEATLDVAALPADKKCDGAESSVALAPDAQGNVKVHVVLREGEQDDQLGVQVMRPAVLAVETRIVLLCAALYALGLSLVKGGADCRQFHAVAGALLVFFVSYVGNTGAFVYPIIYWRGMWDLHYYTAQRWQGLYVLGQVMLMGSVGLFCLFRWRPALQPWLWADAWLMRAGGVRPARFVGACAVLFTVVCGVLSQVLFGGLPQIPDSTSHYVQGKIFAGGQMSVAAHPLHEFFEYIYINLVDGRMFSMYLPGHSLLLALGHLAGLPWMVNPVLGGLTVIAVYLLAQELGGRRVGYGAAVLMLLSPFALFMSSEFMSHVSCMFFITVMMFAYIRQHRTQRAGFALLAGFCAGYALITRPQVVAVMVLPLMVHGLVALRKDWRRHWRTTACMAAGGLPFVAVVLLWNHLLMGDARHFSMNGANVFGEHVAHGAFLDPQFFWGYVALAMDQLQALHQQVFGWPGGLSLVFVLLLFVLRGAQGYAVLVMACCLMQAASLLVIPIEDGVFGPRYLYESVGILVALSALGMAELPGLVGARFGVSVNVARARGMIACFVAVMSVAAIPTHVAPYYKLYENEFWAGGDRYYGYLQEKIAAPALVLLAPNDSWWRLGFTLPVDEKAGVIYARTLGDEDQKLMDMYPERHVYRVNGWDIQQIR